MSEASNVQVAVCPEKQALLVKASGSCTMRICRDLKDYVQQFRKPDTTDLYIDLSQTEFIDSTFAGFLLSLVRAKRDPTAPAVHLVAPSKKTLEVLTTMHVEAMFDICDKLPNSASAWVALPSDGPVGASALDIVVRAHQALIDADERNAREFGRVVEGFGEERQRKDNT